MDFGDDNPASALADLLVAWDKRHPVEGNSWDAMELDRSTWEELVRLAKLVQEQQQ